MVSFHVGTSDYLRIKEYQQETGQYFKRIVSYLFSEDDEELPQFSNCSNQKLEFEGPLFQKRFSNDQIQANEMYAKTFQKYFAEKSSNVSLTVKENDYDIAKAQSVKSASSFLELIDVLTAIIDNNGPFFLVIRCGAKLKRQLTIWHRQLTKACPTMKLMVHFAGEEGFDTGAIHNEFLSNIISDILREMFPNGAPIDSMLNAHNGWFRICWEIVNVSLVNGGPPPCFLDKSMYQMLVNRQAVDIQNLNVSKHLTSS